MKSYYQLSFTKYFTFLVVFLVSSIGYGQCNIPIADAGEDQTICKGESVQLNGNLVFSNRAILFNADFNNTSGDNNFTATTYNNAHNWTKTTSLALDGETITSGGTNFYYLQSEGAPTGLNTGNSYLTSPSFSTLGYNDIVITFRQYFRQDIPYHPVNQPDGNSLIYVEYSTDGLSWTSTNITHSSIENFRIGTANNFTTYKATLPTAFDNQGNVKIRFRYFHSNDWIWAIDDVQITGIPNNYNVSWSGGPIESGANTLFPQVNPEQTTTYTFKIQTPGGGCVTTDNVTVYVNSLEPGEIATPQEFCAGNSPTSLQGTLPTGGSPYTYQWETSPNCDGEWQNIPGATSSNYNPGVLTNDKCIRRKVTNECGTAYSTPIVMKNNLKLHFSFDEESEPTDNLIAGDGQGEFDPTFERYAVGEEIAFIDIFGNRKSLIKQLAMNGNPIMEVSTTQSYQGAKSLRLNRMNGTTYAANFARINLSNPVHINQDEEVTYSAWVYSTMAGPQLAMQFKNPSNNVWTDYNSSAHTGSGWEKLILTSTAPNDNAVFEAYFYLRSPNLNSDTYWDNIQVEKKGRATRFVNGERDPATVLDHSGFNNHGKITLAKPAKWIPNGVEAGAYELDGDGEIEFPNPLTSGSQEWTISAWFNIADLNVSNQYFVEGMNRGNYVNFNANHSNPNRSKSPLMYLNSSGYGGDYFIYGDKEAITENKWHFITFVYKQQGNIRKIYLDTIDITNNNEQAMVTTTPSGLASMMKLATNVKGKIDDFRVYNVAMTENEVIELYESYIPKIKVHQLPEITASIESGQSGSVCKGESTTITADGAGQGGTYSWNNGLGQGATHTVSPSTTTTYQVTGTSAAGCQNTATVTVTVNPLPSVSGTASVTPTDCDDDTGQISGISITPSNATITWTDSQGNVVSTSLVAQNLPAGSYYLHLEDANGCEFTAGPYQVTTKNPPTITISGNNQICNGGSTTITASGADSYIWNDQNNSTTPSITVSPTSTTTYEVTGTDVYGCQNTTTYTITVNPLPTVSGTATIEDTDCGSSTGQITGLTVNPSNSTVTWTDENGNVVSNSINASNLGFGNYYLTIVDQNGCETTVGPYSIGEKEAPTITVTATDSEICVGESVTLTATGGSTYLWNDPNNSTTSTITVSPTTTTFYQVIGTDAYGCQNFGSITVTVNPLPTISGTPEITQSDCGGNTGAITGLTIDSNNSTVVWTNESGVVVSSSVDAENLGSGNYTITVTDENGCESSAGPYTIEDKDAPEVVISGENQICEGGEITLLASGADSYQWNDPENSTSDEITVTLEETTEFTVIGTTDGCESTASITVHVSENPVIEIEEGSTIGICYGEEFSLTATGAGENGTYEWDNGLGNGSTQYVSPTGTTTYTVIGTNEFGCQNEDSIKIVVNENPTISIENNQYKVCLGSSITMEIEDSSEEYQYTWIFNDEEINEGTSYTTGNTTIHDGGEYIIIVTNELGCRASAEITLTVQICDLEITEAISPNGDGLNDYFYIEHLEAYPNTEVWIYNRWGEQVYYSEDYQNDWDGKSQSKLNVGNEELPEGTYYYLLKLGGDEGLPEAGKVYNGFVYLKR